MRTFSIWDTLSVPKQKQTDALCIFVLIIQAKVSETITFSRKQVTCCVTGQFSRIIGVIIVRKRRTLEYFQNSKKFAKARYAKMLIFILEVAYSHDMINCGSIYQDAFLVLAIRRQINAALLSSSWIDCGITRQCAITIMQIACYIIITAEPTYTICESYSRMVRMVKSRQYKLHTHPSIETNRRTNLYRYHLGYINIWPERNRWQE